MTLNERRQELEVLLRETQPLWGPSTFRERRPAWCEAHPELARNLLALDEAELASLTDDQSALIAWLAPALPAVRSLPELTALPKIPDAGTIPGLAVGNAGVPGRKIGQISAFLAAIGKPVAPVVEWCSGKGHLGRNLLRVWGGEALAIEKNPALCASGQALAERSRQAQRFLHADVLSDASAECLRGAHAIGLHPCGDLHRRLITAAASVRCPALDVAPCCYQLTADEPYRPLRPESALRLDRNALKLAVTETVTASPREATDSARASAWKLAFVALRAALQPGVAYRPFRPVPTRWLAQGFPHFLQQLATREALPWPRDLDPAAWEARGWQHHHESRRLQLVRMAFRRALEVWILCDLATWLEAQGYDVTLREFCTPTLTPRNLLLSARLG